MTNKNVEKLITMIIYCFVQYLAGLICKEKMPLKSFKCRYCGKCFSRRADAIRHEKIHAGEKPFLCRICGKGFSQSSNCYRHERTHPKEKPKCQRCGATFSRTDLLASHVCINEKYNAVKIKQEADLQVCEVKTLSRSSAMAGYSVANPSRSVAMHSRTLVIRKRYKCSQCGRDFSQSSNCKRHERLHRGDKPYHCKQCDKHFTLSGNLKRHSRTVHARQRNFKCYTGTLKQHEKVHAHEEETHQQEQGKPYQCKECDKCFTDSGKLKHHSKTHVRKKSFQCKEEEQRLLVGQGNTKKLNRMQNTGIKLTHGQKVGNSDNKPYKCKYCGKSYNYPSELKRHEPVHTRQPNFKCQHCDRCFFHTGTLKQHEKAHARAKETHSGNLKRHSQTHAKKKSFQCKEEEKRLLVRQVNRMQNTGIKLTQGQKVHTRQRSFKCQHCSRRFFHTGTLKNHEKVHERAEERHQQEQDTGIKPTHGRKVVDSDNKPYKCLECGKSYSYPCELKRHEPVHTRQRNFKCQHCSRRFFHTGTLKNHEKVHARAEEMHQQEHDKRYQCGECDKSFSNSENLKHHSKTHAKKKPFQCKKEEKRSLGGQVNTKKLNRMQNTRIKLTQGQKVADSENKPYNCKDCGKSYNFPSELKRHEPVHTRQRNFKCQHCSRRFFHTGTLKQHEKMHARVAERHQQEKERAPHLEAQMPRQLKNYTCWICSHEFHCESESVIRKHYDEHLKQLGY